MPSSALPGQNPSGLVDAELPDELIETDAVREPVEEMLHRRLPRKHGAPLIRSGSTHTDVIVAFIVWCLRSQGRVYPAFVDPGPLGKPGYGLPPATRMLAQAT